MAVRVFVALLVSDDGRRTAAELAEMLRVSPAAVSNAVRYLQQVRLVAGGNPESGATTTEFIAATPGTR